jgi:beta-glucanase (GH16 family)
MPAISLVGYLLSYDDEFSNPALFQTSWDGSVGYRNALFFGRTIFPNAEAEYYVDPNTVALTHNPNPFLVAGGALTITAQPTLSGQQTDGLPYTSGMISTDGSFSQNQGYFEIRAQTPDVAGFWSAFWMLPDGNTGYPELDVLEQPSLGSSGQYWSYANFSATNKGGGFNEANVDLSKGFHSYGLLWTATTITFYLDGLEVGGAVSVPDAFTAKMHLIANLAVGGNGSWPKPPTGATTASYSIDYIRAYSADAKVAAVALQAISSPDGANTTPVYTAPVMPLPAVIGTGPDTLVLNISEDAYQSDAHFTISIDGVQQGGVMIAQADHALGQAQAFTIAGDFSYASHSVIVNFLNDFGVGPGADRNLYVNSASLNAKALAGSTLSMYSAGPQGFVIPVQTGPVTPPTLQTLTLGISEDAWQGDAQYQVLLDGVALGGFRLASAAHSAGLSQNVAITGTWSTDAHSIAVTFLNDGYGGSATADRNLYVDSVSFNGVSATGAPATLLSNGTAYFVAAAAASGPVIPPPTPTQSLTLRVSEDSWAGDALYRVSVDGTTVGAVRTATASHQAGATETVTVAGSWGAGAHKVGVEFINDAYGGSAGTDRTLYVESVSIDGRPSPGAPAALLSNGLVTFVVPGARTTTPNADLILNLSEDAFQGNALFTVAVDGTQLGLAQAVTALHGGGASQAFGFPAALSVGSHDISISFLNDLYGGAADLDRNLYINGATAGGIAVPGAAFSLLSTGTHHFSVVIPPAV